MLAPVVTTLFNLLRMLYSRAGAYPPDQPLLHAKAFSSNIPESACPRCHGHGRIYTATGNDRLRDHRTGFTT